MLIFYNICFTVFLDRKCDIRNVRKKKLEQQCTQIRCLKYNPIFKIFYTTTRPQYRRTIVYKSTTTLIELEKKQADNHWFTYLKINTDYLNK